MKSTRLFAISVSILAMSFFANCANANSSKAAEAGENAQAEIEATTGATGVDNVITPTSDSAIRPGMKPDRLTVIDFNATWCGPCRIFSPSFHKAAANFGNKVDFYSIDTDEFPKTANAFGIQGIPTIVFITPDGKMTSYVGLTDFVKGLKSQDPSQEELNNVIYKNFAEMIKSYE